MAEKQTTEKQSTFKELVLPVIVLVVICLVCSALLAVLNDITAPIIAENTQAETLAAYVSVLPEGTTTDSMTAIDAAIPIGYADGLNRRLGNRHAYCLVSLALHTKYATDFLPSEEEIAQMIKEIGRASCRERV